MDENWDDNEYQPTPMEPKEIVDYGTGYGRGRGIIKNDSPTYPGSKSFGRNDCDGDGFGDSTNNNTYSSSSYGGRPQRGSRGGRGGRGSSRGGGWNRNDGADYGGNHDNDDHKDNGFSGGSGYRGGDGFGGDDGFDGGDSFGGGGRGRGGRGRGRNNESGRNTESGRGGDEEEQRPKVTYIPPEPSNDENEIFGSGISTGINFAKYDSIRINVTGENAPRSINYFDDSGLRPLLLQNIKKCNYTKPTPVQKYAIPIIMAGRDLMACAQTGSGKTAAFLLPIIHNILEDPVADDSGDTDSGYGRCVKPLAFVVSPTRELAIQIQNEARKFAHSSIVRSVVVYGGTSTMYQSSQVQKGCHILVATPGRLLDMVDKCKISFGAARFIVLDEADRMLDMGFIPDIERMMSHSSMVPTGERQTLMFSATFPVEIQKLAGKYLSNYLFLTVGIVGGACSDVEQRFFEVSKFDKRKKLIEILKETPELEKTLVFVEQKRIADFIAAFLSEQDFPTTSIHGDRLQSQREEALRDFKRGDMPILVATAVAARGLDIKDVAHVVNFDLPKSIDEYVHRIGRTGRVGNRGRATSFYDSEQDSPLARDLVKILTQANQNIPSWLEQASAGSGGSTGSFGGRFGGRDFRKPGRYGAKLQRFSTPLPSSGIYDGNGVNCRNVGALHHEDPFDNNQGFNAEPVSQEAEEEW